MPVELQQAIPPLGRRRPLGQNVASILGEPLGFRLSRNPVAAVESPLEGIALARRPTLLRLLDTLSEGRIRRETESL